MSTVIGVAITVLLIDSLLKKRKEASLQRINKLNSDFIKLFIDHFMYRILSKFDLIDIKKHLGENVDFSNAYGEFKKHEKREKILSSLSDKIVRLDEASYSFIKDLIADLKKPIEGLIKNLKDDIKPYPDPGIIDSLHEILYCFEVLDANNMLKDIYLHKMPAETKNKEKDKFEPGFKVLLGHVFEIQCSSKVSKMLEDLIEIRDRAYNNRLHFYIE